MTVSPCCYRSELGIYVIKSNERTEDSLFESKSPPFGLTFFQSTFSPVCADCFAVCATSYPRASSDLDFSHVDKHVVTSALEIFYVMND